MLNRAFRELSNGMSVYDFGPKTGELWTAQRERLAFVKLSRACVLVSHGLWPVILTRASDCLSSGAPLDGP